MADLTGFDASQVPEQQEFSALPEGQYVVIATASEKRPTKRGDGAYLQVTFEVVDGPNKGRKLWARINLWNPSQTAKDIAQRELAALCRSVGIMIPGDSSNLHNKPLVVTVGVELDDRNRESNVIKKYEPVGAVATPAFAPAAPVQAAPAAPVVPPWQK